MANKSVKITFDTDIKGLKKALADAKSSVKDFGKELKSVADQIKSSLNSEANAAEMVSAPIKKQIELEKQKLKLQKDSERSANQAQKAAKQGLSDLARVAGLGGIPKLLAFATNPMALGIAAVAAAAAYGAKEIFQGARQYEQGAGARVMLQRRGFGGAQERGDIHALVAAGMTPEEARQALLTGANTFGRNLAVPGITAAVGGARALGVGLGAVTGAGETMRQAAGNQETFRLLKNSMGAALAERLENPEAYLKSISGLIAGIAQDGLTLEAGTIDKFADLVSKTGFSPESMAKTFQGINDAIKGSAQAGGERAAFFQAAAFRSGLGGGTIGGARFITQTGLGQVNANQFKGLLNAEEIKGLKDLGATQSKQGFAKTIVGQIEGMLGGTRGKQRVASEAYYMEKFFGIGGTEGLKALGILRRLADPKISETERKKAEKELQDVMPKSTEEKLLEQQAQRAMALERIGESSRNAILDIRTLLTNIDQTIGGALGIFGFTPKGAGEVRQQRFEQLGPEGLSNAELDQERADLMSRKSRLESQLGGTEREINAGGAPSWGQMVGQSLLTGQNVPELASQLVQVNKWLSQIASHGKETSKNTKHSGKSGRPQTHPAR